MTKLPPKVRPDISDWTADNLKSWRDQHSFSQTEAASAIGIGRQQWLKMESGHKAIDLVVYLACRGYDSENAK